MVSPTALLTALVLAQEHGDLAEAIQATGLHDDDFERIDGLQHALERQLSGLPHESALSEALGLGFLAGQVTYRPVGPLPNMTSFLLDEQFVVRGAEGDSIMHLPWFAEDMFVARSLWDIYEMPSHVRESGLSHYQAVMQGERRRWSFTSCGLAYDVDSVPVAGHDGRPIAVLALTRLMHDPDDDGVMALTPRERELLQLAAEGVSGPDIADALTISAATVKTHFQNIYAKLGVSDRTAAVAKALRKRAIL